MKFNKNIVKQKHSLRLQWNFFHICLKDFFSLPSHCQTRAVGGCGQTKWRMPIVYAYYVYKWEWRTLILRYRPLHDTYASIILLFLVGLFSFEWPYRVHFLLVIFHIGCVCVCFGSFILLDKVPARPRQNDKRWNEWQSQNLNSFYVKNILRYAFGCAYQNHQFNSN